jgi:hypothetical protein
MSKTCQVVLLGFPLINKEGLEVLNVKDTPRYMKYMDYLIGQVFIKEAVDKGWTISDLGKPELFRELYGKTRSFLAKDYELRKENLSPKVKQDLVRIAKNWDIFAAYHSKYNAVAVSNDMYEEVTQDTSAEEGQDLEDDKREEFDSTGNDKSTYELASNNLKLLFRLLPKLRVTSVKETEVLTEEFLEPDGLPSAVDFASLWNNLAQKLAGKKDDTDFINTLTSPESIKVFPELTVVNKLLNINGSKSKQQVQQIAEFYKVFTRPIVKLYMTKKYGKDNDINYRFFPQLRGNTDKIRSTYISNFISENIPEHLKKYTVRDGEFNELRIVSLPPRGTTPIGNVNYLDVDIPTVFKSELELLALMGINLSGIPLITTYTEREKFIKLLTKVRDVIYPNVESRLGKKQRITSPIEDLSVKYEGDSANRNIIDEIIGTESYYSQLSPTLMTRNSKGEPQSDLSNDNAITVAIYDLNSARTIGELFTRPSFKKGEYSHLLKTSKALEFLFDKEGNKVPNRSIDVINYNGAFIDEAKVTRDLSELEKRIIDFNNMLQDGVNDIMRTETSNSFYALRMVDGTSSSPYYRSNSFSESFLSNQAFVKDMDRYLAAELARIKDYDSNPAAYKTTKNYGKFSIFSDILSPELQEQIKADPLNKDNVEAFHQAIEKYFQPQVDLFVNKLQSGKIRDIISTSLIKETPLRDLAISFLANSFVNNIEASALVTGEPLFYEKNDMPKRLKGLASTGALASVINDINNFLYANENEQAWKKAYSLSSALGVQHRDNSANFKTQVINEAESDDGAYTQEAFKEGIQQSIKLRDGRDVTIEEINEMVKDGAVIKVSDGQGRVTLDFHRELSFRFGFWTPEAEVAYQYQGLYFRKANNMPFDENEFNSLRTLIYSDPAKYAIPVLKVTYFGNVENADVKVDAKAYDKFSIAPLLPSFIVNHPELDTMNKKMLRNQMGYVKYESATKLFVRNKVGLSQIGKDADIYTTPLLKEQLKTSIKQKEESSIPTQFSKLLVANLFNQGKAINERVQKVYDNYVNTLLDIQKEHQVELLDDLGYSYNIIDGKPSITGFSPEKLFNKIQIEVSRQAMSSNVSRAIEVNRDANGKITSFKYSPEATGVYSIINDYIAGIMDKTMRRYKVNSADFVLLSPANIANKLKYYEYNENGIEPCECKITLTSSFVNLLNKINPKTGTPIGDIETLNSLLKDKEWREQNKKALTVVMSRPPVGGPNSMGHAIVEEFIDPTAGNVLMLPEEFIAKAGIDFDIDKEKTIIPLLSKSGEFLSQASLDKIGDEIRRLEGEYPELREYAEQYDAEQGDSEYMLKDDDTQAINNFINRIFGTVHPDQAVVNNDDARYQAYKAYFSFKNQLDNSATNRLLEQYIPILSLPELFADLVIPNSTNMVKALAAANARDLGRVEAGLVSENGSVQLPSMGKVYEYDEQLRTMQSYFASKSLLGGFAIDNTAQQLYTQNGIEINKKYFNINKKGKLTPRYINMLLFSPEQRRKVERGNRIVISNRFNLEKGLIQHYNSEFINAYVDSAKDLFASELNINWRNIGPYNLLKDIGLDPEVVTDFINLPVIRKYIEYRNQFNDKDKALGTLLAEMGIGIVSTEPVEKLIKYPSPGISAVGKKLIRNPNDKNDKSMYFKATVEVSRIVPFERWGALSYVKKIDEMSEGLHITPERLRELKDNSNFSSLPEEEKVARKTDYINLLANFVAWENHASALSQFRRLYNYDTTKISSSFEVKAKDLTRDTVRKRNLIPSEYIDQMDNRSIVSAFINNSLISSMFDTVFTVTNDPKVQGILSALYSAYDSSFTKNDKLLAAMPKVLNNEFLRSVVDNYGTFNGENVYKYSVPLIAKLPKENNQTLVDRLTNIRKTPTYATLVRNFSIFNNFVPDIGTETAEGIFRYQKEDKAYLSKPNNIRFIRSSTEIQSETEGFIEQFRRLLSPDLEIEGIPKAYLEKVKALTKDLLIAGYFQSGFGKTFQGYNDLIPTEFVINMYQDAINKFSALDDAEKSNYMNQFYVKFKLNNPSYFEEGQKEAAKRGKNYRIDANRGMAKIVAMIKKDASTDPAEKPQPPQPVEQSPISDKVVNTRTGLTNETLLAIQNLSHKGKIVSIEDIEDYGKAATYFYSEFDDVELSVEEAEWMRDNPTEAETFVYKYEEDTRSDGIDIQEYAARLIEVNNARFEWTHDELEGRLSPELFDVINSRRLDYRYYDFLTEYDLQEIADTVEMPLAAKEELQNFIKEQLGETTNPNQLSLFSDGLPILPLSRDIDPTCK